MDTLGAWGSSWLGCWLAGWQLAGWLVGWVLRAGWLAGHGHPRIQRTHPLEGKITFQGRTVSFN